MNEFQVTGKIWEIREQSKVDFVTIVCRDGKKVEWLDITIFKNPFFSRYFNKGSWISIRGYIHKSKYNGKSRLELIADKLYFAGDPPKDNRENVEPEGFNDIEAENEVLPWEISDTTTQNSHANYVQENIYA